MNRTSRRFSYVPNEYLLILSPPKELGRRIWSIKYSFARSYQAPLAYQTAPHITLVNFVAHGAREEAIIKLLLLIGMGITPFGVELKNFGAFEASGTIYINVATKESIRGLVRELKQARHLFALNSGFPPHFTKEPHLTVCRRLGQDQYTTAWTDYANLGFEGSFTAGSMTLLKKVYGTNQSCTVGQFAFQSTPVLPKQGHLFV